MKKGEGDQKCAQEESNLQPFGPEPSPGNLDPNLRGVGARRKPRQTLQRNPEIGVTDMGHPTIGSEAGATTGASQSPLQCTFQALGQSAKARVTMRP